MAARAVWWIAAALAVALSDSALSSFPSYRCYNQHKEADKPTASVLDLHESNITTVNAFNLICYPNLLQLNLNGNKIRKIESNAFYPVGALQNLFLADNALLGKKLAPNLFRDCLQLRAINFSGNDMSDTPAPLLGGLSRLESLYMNSCSLFEMPPILAYSVLPNLKMLQLKSNKISIVDHLSFAYFSNLESIYPSNNQIIYLHEDLLKPLTAIVHIFLPGNRIRYIPEGFFHNKSSLSHIDLSYNFIENVPVDAFFGTGLQILNLSGNRLTYLSDQFCSNLRSMGVGLEQFYFAKNPWQCSCLNEVLVETKRLNIWYEPGGKHNDRFKYDGKHPVCIMTDNFKCHRIEVYQNLFYNVINGI